ncbi:MAG: hypothetical protein WDN46_12700 [Methylocella sp.]
MNQQAIPSRTNSQAGFVEAARDFLLRDLASETLALASDYARTAVLFVKMGDVAKFEDSLRSFIACAREAARAGRQIIDLHEGSS